MMLRPVHLTTKPKLHLDERANLNEPVAIELILQLDKQNVNHYVQEYSKKLELLENCWFVEKSTPFQLEANITFSSRKTHFNNILHNVYLVFWRNVEYLDDISVLVIEGSPLKFLIKIFNVIDFEFSLID